MSELSDLNVLFGRSDSSYYPTSDILSSYPDTTKPDSFQDLLRDTQRRQQKAQVDMVPEACEQELIPLCCDLLKSKANADRELDNILNVAAQNIVNANKPNYQKVLPYKGEDGEYMVDRTPGHLLKSDSPTHLAIGGPGKGFQLVNGEYTRDGRFTFDEFGRLVTVDGAIPVEVCYKEGAPVDWSLKQLKVDKEGKVSDRATGKTLGWLKLEKDSQAFVAQGYMEESNVNVPIEMIEFTKAIRFKEALNGIQSSEARLNSEAIQVAKGVL